MIASRSKYLGIALILLLTVVSATLIYLLNPVAPVEARFGGTTSSGSTQLGMPEANGRFIAAPPTSTVTAATVTQTPNTPGAPAKYEIKFTTPSQLDNGSDTIVITFDNEIGVPTPLDRFSISISADSVTNGGAAGEAVAPLDVTVDLVGIPADQSEVTLLVPDMDSSDNSGGNGIAAGASVTVVFRQSAGLTNATESGNDPVLIRTSQDTTDFKVNVFTPVLIEMSNDDGSRGDERIFLAKGIEGKESVTFWLDYDADGVRDASERDLCTLIADSDDTAACVVIISNPPFFPGRFGPGGSCTIGFVKDCNFINVIDSEGRTAPTATQADINQVNFELEPTVEIQPDEVSFGDTVTFSLFDYPAGAKVDKILIGKINVTPATISETIAANGEKSFSFVIPGVAPATIPDDTDGGKSPPDDGNTTADVNPDAGSRIRTGKLRVDVFTGYASPSTADDADQDFNLTITGADLTVFPEEVVANQTLIITGSGFTPGSGTCILQGGITLNNVALKIDTPDNCAFGTGVAVTSGGTFSLAVIVSQLSGNIPTALLTPGSYELKVIDNNGILGILSVQVKARSLSVDPESSGPGSEILVSGSGFPSANASGSAIAINVKYECGTSAITVSATTDVLGDFQQNVTVPSNCAIPSTNTITVEIQVNGVNTGVVEIAIHQVPSGSIALNPTEQASGETVEVVGANFPSLTQVESLTINGIGVLTGSPVTDTDGGFVIDFVVPFLPLGLYIVEAEVGTGDSRTTANAILEVIDLPPDIGVSPWSLSETLAAGGSSTLILRISNDGSLPLDFDIDVVDTTSSLPFVASPTRLPDPSGWAKLADDLATSRSGSSSGIQQAATPSILANVPSITTIIVDPEGDAVGGPPVVDIIRVEAGADEESLALQLFFSDATSMDDVTGYVHLDTDQDPNTGLAPVALFGLESHDIGVDFFLNLFTLRHSGVISVFDKNFTFMGDVTPTITGQSILVNIPLSLLGGDDGQADVTMALGNSSEPTDWAPDAGHGTTGPVVWLSVEPAVGTVPAEGIPEVVIATFDATNLVTGTYTANLVIHSNDPDEDPLMVPIVLTVLPSADLSVTKAAAPDPVDAGADLTYTIVVTNAPLGSTLATGVTLTDELPPNVSFVSATPTQGTCNELGGVVTCSLGDLDPGASATVDIVVTPLVGGVLTNTATVTGDVFDPDLTNNSDTIATMVTADCTLVLTPSYADGTLTIDILFGPVTPGTLSIRLISGSAIIPILVPTSVPAIDPPATKSISLPVAPQGIVPVFASLNVPIDGVICFDFKSVDTGIAP